MKFQVPAWAEILILNVARRGLQPCCLRFVCKQCLPNDKTLRTGLQIPSGYVFPAPLTTDLFVPSSA